MSYIPPAYASIYVAGAAITMDPADFTAYTQLTGFTALGPSYNCSGDFANNKISVSLLGDYLVNCGLSFSGTPSSTFTVKPYYVGLPAPGIQSAQRVSAVGDTSFIACNGLVACTGIGDITVYAAGDGAGDTMLIKDLILTAAKVG
jgi:hypothetical protein